MLTLRGLVWVGRAHPLWDGFDFGGAVASLRQILLDYGPAAVTDGCKGKKENGIDGYV